MRGTLGTTAFDTAAVDSAWDRWISTKDAGAREVLVERYVPFVRYMAGRLGPQVSPYLRPELFSLGLLGLLDALDKFDPAIGVRFETYAGTRIRGAMHDGIRRMGPLPRGARQQASGMIRSIHPVDFQTAISARGVRLQDCLEDLEQPSVFAGLERLADRQELQEAVEALPDRERIVIQRHYYDGLYLKAIGAELGVTESRVCQIHRRALKMLEHRLLRLRAA